MTIQIHKINHSPEYRKDLFYVRHSQARRQIFDNGHSFAYKCVPLVEANKFGYELFVKEDIVIEWNGQQEKNDVIVHSGPGYSHFGIGTFTLGNIGIWKTPPGYDLLLTPSPNSDTMDKFYALSALIETDWLNYPWFLSIRLTRPGKITIPAETTLANVMLIKRFKEESAPEIIEYDENDPVHVERLVWQEERNKRHEAIYAKGKSKRQHHLYRKNMVRRVKNA